MPNAGHEASLRARLTDERLREAIEAYRQGWPVGTRDGYDLMRDILVAALTPAPSPACMWNEDDDGNWWTSCGEGFIFTTDGGPDAHKFSYCPYCGRHTAAGITHEDVRDWWAHHQQEDRARRAREAGEAEHRRLLRSASGKLTPAERAALGLD